MEFDHVLAALLTYGAPFLLTWMAYDWARKRPRTGWTILWTVVIAALAIWGFVNLALDLKEWLA